MCKAWGRLGGGRCRVRHRGGSDNAASRGVRENMCERGGEGDKELRGLSCSTHGGCGRGADRPDVGSEVGATCDGFLTATHGSGGQVSRPASWRLRQRGFEAHLTADLDCFEPGQSTFLSNHVSVGTPYVPAILPTVGFEAGAPHGGLPMFRSPRLWGDT